MTRFILSLSHWRMLGITTFVIWKALRKNGTGVYSWSAYAIWRHTQTLTHTHTHTHTRMHACTYTTHTHTPCFFDVCESAYTLFCGCIFRFTQSFGHDVSHTTMDDHHTSSSGLHCWRLVCACQLMGWLWVLGLPITWPFQPITTSQLIFCMRSMTKVASAFSLQTKA